MTPFPDSSHARARQRLDERGRPRADERASALSLPSEHFAAIERSHARCTALGLSRIESPAYDPISRADLAVARERNLRLYTHAAPVMELLYEQIVNTQSMVVLTDSRGTIIHSIGDDDFLERASKVALQPGVNWSEAARGTNGMGTTLMNEAPTLVHADEHFMHANQFLTCSAAPIFDPRGNMLGVLDVTGDHRSYHQHTMGLVKMSARMIENHWLADDFRQLMRLHFHSRPEFIGTLMEGIVAVARDGRIVGANRSALDQLGLSGAATRMHSVTSLFGTTVGALVDHFRSPLAMPLPLSLPSGNQVHAQARFNWSAAYGLGDIGGEPNLAEAPPAASTVAAATAPAQAATTAGGLRYLQTGDAQMEAVLAKVQRVIDRDIPILLLGETGTGKELLARAIHHDSARARHPFVAVNCASIPETLIEAELFGYEEGAFTGARRKGAPGKIVQANGGTLFLDEIGDMPLPLQARLLRVLAERIVSPLGSSKTVTVDVAIVGATHRNLREMIAKNEFREDLYYRLNGLVVRIPPLRERSDLEVIVRNMLRAESPRGFLEVDADVMRLIRAYHWPGNVRQLANVLRTAALMAAGGPRITREHLSDDFLEDAQAALAAKPELAERTAAPAAAVPSPPVAQALPAGATLEELELAMIRQAVDAAGGNISEASKRLGISRNTIYRKLRWRRS
jgi:transcriptional regulator of acetoin/glycerol metabolism